MFSASPNSNHLQTQLELTFLRISNYIFPQLEHGHLISTTMDLPIVDNFFDNVLDEVDEQYESASPTESENEMSRVKDVIHVEFYPNTSTLVHAPCSSTISIDCL